MAGLPVSEIMTALASLEGWEYVEGGLRKTFTLPSYTAGLMFASAVGTLAESMNHHPDLHIGYKKVTISVMTHDDGNVVTQHDLTLAQRIEGLGYPSK
ncbi:MAG: 4a-hydroxytetrahydrobiopterin dehydratase [Phototrophicaceae bacterium]